MGYITVPKRGITTSTLPDAPRRAPQGPPNISSGAQRSYYGGGTTDMDFGTVRNGLLNNLRNNGRSGLGHALHEDSHDGPEPHVHLRPTLHHPQGSPVNGHQLTLGRGAEPRGALGPSSRGALGPGPARDHGFNVDSHGSVRPGPPSGSSAKTTSGMLFAQNDPNWKTPVQIPETVGGPRIAGPANKRDIPGAIETTEGKGPKNRRGQAKSPFKAMPNPSRANESGRPAAGTQGVFDTTSTVRPRSPKNQAAHDARARKLWE